MELLEEMEYVGDIPEGWKWVKLGEIVFINSKNLTPNYPYDEIYYLDTGSVAEGRLISSYKKFYLKEAPSRAKRIVNDGDIVYSLVRPIQRHYGIIKNPPDNLIVSTGFAVITADNNKAENRFIYYYLTLDEIVDYLDSIAEGSTTTYPSIVPDDLKNLIIPLPPLPEQKAIAEVLSSLDDKIELLHRQNKTLEEMAMTLFRQWFIEPTKDGLPEGWGEVSLGDSDLSKIIPSGIKKFEGFKTYLATGDVESTLIKGGVEITYNNRPSRANMQPEKYSVWFAKKEGVRKLLMFDDYSNIDKYILSTGFTGLKTTELSHYYIWCFILHEDFQDIKDSLVSGSVQPDIPNEAVSQIFIPRPPDEVLLSFNIKVKPLFIKIQFNNSQIQTLEKLRDTLLPKLISGEVRVKV
jgi:type I restriction enzyme S subunit